MAIKKFIKNLVTLTELNQELNESLNEQIRALKQQIKDEANESKVIGFKMPTED